MMKSRARRALEEALAEATTPESRAAIAAKLARVIDVESRERGRKRRARARRLKDAPAPPPPDDSNEPFDAPASQAPATPSPELTVEQRRENRKTLRTLGGQDIPWDDKLDGPKPKPRDYAAEIKAELEARPVCPASGLPNGFTRKMNGLEANEYFDDMGRHFVWDAAMGCFKRNFREQVFTHNIVPVNDVIDSDTWTNAEGWASEAKNEAEAEADRAWAEYLDKVAGR